MVETLGARSRGGSTPSDRLEGAADPLHADLTPYANRLSEQADPQFLKVPREFLEVDDGSPLVHECGMLGLKGLHRTHTITIPGGRIRKALESEV